MAAYSTSIVSSATKRYAPLPFLPEFGATERKFFLGIEGGFEYNYVFQNGWEFSLIRKNNVNFIHGDTFRNGLLIGLKIPF